MTATLVVQRVEAVQEAESAVFEVRLLLEDESEVALRMNGPTLCSLADMISQYATP